ELDAARECFVTAGGDRHGNVELQAVVELAVRETRGADAFEPATNAGRAAPDALAADLDDAVFGEKIHHVVPHLAIGVVAVSRLQVTYAVLVIQRGDAGLQRSERRIGLRRRTGRRRNRNAGRLDREMLRHHRQIAAAPVDPALFIRAVVLGKVARGGDLPY